MGYCYTQRFRPVALADGMGATRKARWLRNSHCKPWPRWRQRDARPSLEDPIRFLQDAVMAGHHQLLRCASEKG